MESSSNISDSSIFSKLHQLHDRVHQSQTLRKSIEPDDDTSTSSYNVPVPEPVLPIPLPVPMPVPEAEDEQEVYFPVYCIEYKVSRI